MLTVYTPPRAGLLAAASVHRPLDRGLPPAQAQLRLIPRLLRLLHRHVVLALQVTAAAAFHSQKLFLKNFLDT